MKVLVATPDSVFPPSGSAYVAAALRQAGHEVAGHLYRDRKSYVEKLDRVRPDDGEAVPGQQPGGRVGRRLRAGRLGDGGVPALLSSTALQELRARLGEGGRGVPGLHVRVLLELPDQEGGTAHTGEVDSGEAVGVPGCAGGAESES
jgi:hypothetical protein